MDDILRSLTNAYSEGKGTLCSFWITRLATPQITLKFLPQKSHVKDAAICERNDRKLEM